MNRGESSIRFQIGFQTRFQTHKTKVQDLDSCSWPSKSIFEGLVVVITWVVNFQSRPSSDLHLEIQEAILWVRIPHSAVIF